MPHVLDSLPSAFRETAAGLPDRRNGRNTCYEVSDAAGCALVRPGLLLHPVRVVARVPAAHGAGRLPLQLPDPVRRGPHPLRQADPQLARRPRPGRVRPAVPAVPRNRGRAGRARALPAPRRAPAGGSGRRPVPPLRYGALPAVLGAARRQRAPAASLPRHGRRPPRWPTATPRSCR